MTCLAIQLANAIRYLHQHQIVHGDIATRNCTYVLRSLLCCVFLSQSSASVWQGCVRGQHGRGQGQGQGHKILSSRCPRGRGQSSRTPIPGPFTPRCYAESGYATSSVCPSLSNSAPYCLLLCLCMKYCIYSIDYSVLYLLTILKNSTSYGQISKPKPRPRIVEAKAKAKATKFCPRGRGQSSRTPSLIDRNADNAKVHVAAR